MVMALLAFFFATAGRGPEPYHLTVRLRTAYGIAPGDPVLISGAPVGKITTLRVLSDGSVAATFTVEQAHRLPLHPKVMVTTALLGTRRLEIVRPVGSTPEDAAPVAVLRSAQELENDPFVPLERAIGKTRRDAAVTMAVAQDREPELLRLVARLQADRALLAQSEATIRASLARSQSIARTARASFGVMVAPTPPPALLAHAQRVEAALLTLRSTRPPSANLGPEAKRNLIEARAAMAETQANLQALQSDLRTIRH